MKQEKAGHPLERFRYCPVCGGAHFEENDFKSKRCRDCGFVLYMNASAAVAGIVIDDRGRLLVSSRAYEPAKGTLDLPGGFVDMDETIEEAIRREMKEETGVDVEVERYLFSLPNRYLFSGLSIPTIDHFILCRLKHPEALCAADDVSSLQWMKLDGIDRGLFGLTSVRRALVKIEAWYQEERSGQGK